MMAVPSPKRRGRGPGTLAKCLVVLSLLATTAIAEEPDPRQLGREYTARFLAGETDYLWERLPAGMREHFQDPESLQAWSDLIRETFGPEAELKNEEVIPRGTGSLYRRIATFEKEETPATFEWTFDAKGRPVAFRVDSTKAAGFSRYLKRETKADLRLPFEGEWTVAWGGRTVAQNYHVFTTDQRFAYDILMTKDGETHEGDGNRLNQYYCWEKPVFAAADGVIVEARGDLPDQVRGKMDEDHPPGNHVVIDHGHDEFSLLAHMRQGSVVVKAGDRVKKGDRLGKCGNSGNTSEPHIHFHLQDRPGFDPGHAQGLPAQFQDYVADGKHVDRGEPTRGQVIRPEKP